MKLPYKRNRLGSELSRIGITYFEYGTVLKGKKQMFTFFKTSNFIYPEQIELIKKLCPDVQVLKGSPSYAPEIKRTAILFPKIAWYREQKTAQPCAI